MSTKKRKILFGENKVKKAMLGNTFSLFRTLFLVGIGFVVLYPLLTQVSSSFMTVSDVYDNTVRFIPRSLTFENFHRTMFVLNYPESLINTVVLVSIVSVFHIASSTTIAYGLARYNFRIKNLLFALVIFGMIIPPNVLVVPYFLRFRYFDFLGIINFIIGNPINFIDTYVPFSILALTGTGLRNGLYIFIMRQYFKGMPKELEESAYVDGAGPFRAFMRIILPGSVTMMTTIFLFSFVWQWLDVIYTPVFLSRHEVIPTVVGNLIHPIATETAEASQHLFASITRNAGIILVILPLIFVYLIAQKFFVQSIERSGLVG